MARRRFSRSTEENHTLSLTSLMDIVTNILVYTIKIFAVSPILIQDPSVVLPKSTSRDEAPDAVVVMITGKKRIESNGTRIEAIHEVPSILVDDQLVVELNSEDYRVPAKFKQGPYLIEPLKQELLRVRKSENATAKLTEKGGFSGTVVIVADKNTPFRLLSEVLVTCGEAGFGAFKFAIAKLEA